MAEAAAEKGERQARTLARHVTTGPSHDPPCIPLRSSSPGLLQLELRPLCVPGLLCCPFSGHARGLRGFHRGCPLHVLRGRRFPLQQIMLLGWKSAPLRRARGEAGFPAPVTWLLDWRGGGFWTSDSARLEPFLTGGGCLFPGGGIVRPSGGIFRAVYAAQRIGLSSILQWTNAKSFL